MLDIATGFDERGDGRLTEQSVRELLTAARSARWADRQAHTLALLIFLGRMTPRAAATLEEAVPGLAEHLARQKASGLRLEALAARSDAAETVRRCVREAERIAAGAAAREIRRWDGSRELRPRFPAVEMCAGALEDALARGATFVMRSGVVDCSGQHPSGFLLQSHWNRVAFDRCRADCCAHSRGGTRSGGT